MYAPLLDALHPAAFAETEEPFEAVAHPCHDYRVSVAPGRHEPTERPERSAQKRRPRPPRIALDPARPNDVLVALERRNRAELGLAVDRERSLAKMTRELDLLALDAQEPDDLDPARCDRPEIPVAPDGLGPIGRWTSRSTAGREQRREIALSALADDLIGEIPRTPLARRRAPVPRPSSRRPIRALDAGREYRSIPGRAAELRTGRGRVSGRRRAVELQAALSSQLRVQGLAPPGRAPKPRRGGARFAAAAPACASRGSRRSGAPSSRRPRSIEARRSLVDSTSAERLALREDGRLGGELSVLRLFDELDLDRCLVGGAAPPSRVNLTRRTCGHRL